jgi:hypothetical protein
MHASWSYIEITMLTKLKDHTIFIIIIVVVVIHRIFSVAAAMPSLVSSCQSKSSQ